MIRRSSYLQRLPELKGQNVIKVLIGVRRSGKFTVMEAFKNLHLTEWSVLYNEIYKYPILHEFLIKILAYTLIIYYFCIGGIIT